ncbi:Imm21 family immunity protein [Actinomadura sp. WMMB 499]|uniref:Imm21 family immunity protein n=1 Tax=Actinomadura sp. WMMB 499 TaxID=1219491 RepID=UPI001245636E|nr:Imm21 family immunity protein [Actinomadura sp. WMMB 499]QFG24389.1 hypothetical protein F7P10_27950 [Actinomadura sp. WMMB 499]
MLYTWVESGGGPLVVVPGSRLVHWGGAEDCEGPEETGDYGLACAVEGYIGLVPVGGGQGLVLGDEPAMTTWLPDERCFLRWSAADSEAGLVDAARRALRSDVEWDERLTWDVDGPVVLFDSAWPGAEPGNQVGIDLEPGTYDVRSVYREDDRNWMILVHLQPV